MKHIIRIFFSAGDYANLSEFLQTSFFNGLVTLFHQVHTCEFMEIHKAVSAWSASRLLQIDLLPMAAKHAGSSCQ